MDLIRVELEGLPCNCAGTPHATEWVDLLPAATLPMGMAAMSCLQQSQTPDASVFYGEVAPILLLFGIWRWSFVDADGAREPITADSIARLLPFGGGGYEVSNRAMGLYIEEIMAPLARKRSRLLGLTPTDSSTSPTPASGGPLPTPLSRSSRRATAGRTSAGPGL